MTSRREPTLAVVSTIALLGLGMAMPCQVVAQPVQERTVASGTSRGMAAVHGAARNGKYLFIFFWKANEQHSRTMFGVFRSAMEKWVTMALEQGKLGNFLYDDFTSLPYAVLRSLVNAITRLPSVKKYLASADVKSRFLKRLAHR